MSAVKGSIFLQLASFTLDLDFDLPGSGVTAIFGESGSGKSTFLRCLAGLEPTCIGQIEINGDTWQDEKIKLPVHDRPLGMVFQHSILFEHLSVRDNLLFGLKRLKKNNSRYTLEYICDLLQLDVLLNRDTRSLSGGEIQRVAIGRALLRSPQVLIMDEPLSALDMVSRDTIMGLLEQLQRELEIPILYVSHNIDEVVRLAEHMIVLDKGKAVASGTITEVLNSGDLAVLKGEEIGTVIKARVLGHDEADKLSFLDLSDNQSSAKLADTNECENLKLIVSHCQLEVNTTVRLRILARDVSIAREKPQSSSILNIIPARISKLTCEKSGQCLVELDLDGCSIKSRVTSRSRRLLDLCEGELVFAQIKSVALIV
jgi:molybdate transport system ATP-binding protein